MCPPLELQGEFDMGKGRLTANPPNVPGPVGMYSHIARVDAKELLFLAGQVAVDDNGEVLAKGDAGAQTRIAYERVGAILADAGATYQDIVQVRTYLVGTENRQSYLDEREKLFGEIYADRSFSPEHVCVRPGTFPPGHARGDRGHRRYSAVIH